MCEKLVKGTVSKGLVLFQVSLRILAVRSNSVSHVLICVCIRTGFVDIRTVLVHTRN